MQNTGVTAETAGAIERIVQSAQDPTNALGIGLVLALIAVLLALYFMGRALLALLVLLRRAE